MRALPACLAVAAVSVVAALAPAPVAAGPVADASRYLLARQDASGGFAEPGRAPTPGLSAWAVLGLRAAGTSPARLEEARRYLERTAPALESPTDLELSLAALAALGQPPRGLVARVAALRRDDGSIGPTVNSTIWGVIALRAAGEPAPPGAVRFLLRAQHRSGGWSWARGAAPDSNDTAAAVQALRAAGTSPRHVSIRRAIRFLRRHQRPDGGFELARGRGSDVQSTAWAVQALLSARERPGRRAYAYLAGMRRPNGSYRYSARYAVTPVWVTAQALGALAGKPLPLR